MEALLGRIEMLIKQGTIDRRRENCDDPLGTIGIKVEESVLSERRKVRYRVCISSITQ